MTNDCIAQSWYRFLKTIGNPVSLTKPEVCHFHKKIMAIILREYVLGDKSNSEISTICY